MPSPIQFLSTIVFPLHIYQYLLEKLSSRIFKSNYRSRGVFPIVFRKHNQQFHSMGCESSLAHPQDTFPSHEQTSSQSQVQLDYHNFVQRQRGNVIELYHFSKVVWRGRSIVRKVLQRNSRIDRACKVLAVSKKYNFFRCYQQIQILKKLSHPNITQIVEYFDHKKVLYIIQQHIDGKSLHQLYCDPEIRHLPAIVQILKQTLIALNFMHSKQYVHLAINPQHIMVIKIEEQQALLVKLVGFGKATKRGATKVASSSITDCNSLFRAPENDQTHLAKQDIWACGVILLQLISGGRRFQYFLKNKEKIISSEVSRLHVSSQQKTIIADFLSKMLEVSPEHRLSASQALEHDFFKMDLKKGDHQTSKANEKAVLERLLQFKFQNKLKYLFSMYASINILSSSQKAQHVIQFYNLDKNKDGKIDFNQLVESLQNTYGIEQQAAVQKVKQIFDRTSKQHDQCIQYHQYLTATTVVSKQMNQRIMAQMFEQFDSNHDGNISSLQLSKCIKGVNPNLLLKDMKKDKLSIEQFRQLMLQMFKQQEKQHELL